MPAARTQTMAGRILQSLRRGVASIAKPAAADGGASTSGPAVAVELFGYSSGPAGAGTEARNRHRAALAALQESCSRTVAETVQPDGSRPELAPFVASLPPGAALVVPGLDHLVSSASDLASVLDSLARSGCHLRSLAEDIDTARMDTAMAGRLVAAMVGEEPDAAAPPPDPAQHDDATGTGAESARKRRSPVTAKEDRAALKLLREGVPVAEVCKQLGISRSTLYRRIPAENWSSQGTKSG